MRKFRIITVLMGIVTLLHGVPMTYAAPQVYTDGGRTDTKAYTDSSDSVEQHLNFSYFEVDVTKSGKYFAEFWVLPAKYADGTYTNFSVYVNDEYVGQIVPDRDNWQSARIVGNKKISLREGSNILKVGVPTPEMPAVETVQVGLTESEAMISSSEYEEFYNKISVGMTYDLPKGEVYNLYTDKELQSTQASNTQGFSPKHFYDVPLKYTFYKEFKFQEGEFLSISTSSLSEHDVDVLYLGEYIPLITGSTALIDSMPQIPVNIDCIDSENTAPTSVIIKPIPFKPRLMYTLGSSDELQGLNWKGLSWRQPGNNYNNISKLIKIPKTGVYLIRLRHRFAGESDIATLNVNGEYTYLNVPISFSWIPCEIPANGITYGTMTICNNYSTDDPMLFIHGAAADRIVGYCDDASRHLCSVHDLSYTDSYIAQEYKVKTYGISVSNYRSSNPESVCTIIAGMDESLFEPDPGLQLMPKKNQNDSLKELTTASNEVSISGSLEQCGVLQVSAQSDIRNITISDLSGKIIKSFKGEGSRMNIAGTSVNILYAGIYVVSVETNKGIVSKKLIVY